MDREKAIVKTSILGITANVFLAAFKAVIGIISRSIAITMDAVNNLSDALSSLITIIGTKLAAKAPDKKHPLGHGRAEYLTATVIAIIVLYAGITSLVESIKKIIHPETPDYSIVSLIIIAVAVVVKILLGTHFKNVGKRLNSDSLTASGSDALFDSLISASTLVAALIFIFFKIKLEAYLGVVISLLIIKTGVEILSSTISKILGERIDPQLAKQIKQTVVSFPGVGGAYDLVVNNYGPNLLIGSIHIEVPDTITAHELYELERAIGEEVLKKHGVIMTGISVYPCNTSDQTIADAEKIVKDITSSYPDILETHGFYMDEPDKRISFDIIVDYAADRAVIYDEVCERVKAAYPDYNIAVTLDSDISD